VAGGAKAFLYRSSTRPATGPSNTRWIPKPPSPERASKHAHAPTATLPPPSHHRNHLWLPTAHLCSRGSHWIPRATHSLPLPHAPAPAIL
jgi:hypothetical protein